MGRNIRTAVLIHLGFWSPQMAIARGARKPGTKSYRLDGGFPADEYLDILFTVDNNPDARNEPVRLLKHRGPTYSASMGDVIKIGTRFFRCEAIGWKQLTRPEFLEYLKTKGLGLTQAA